MHVSVVVPVYYNAPSLPLLIERLSDVAAQLQQHTFEFVFVDDGSGDDSYAVLAEQSRRDARVRGLRLSRNFGSNAAILAGLSYAQGDALIVIAADLQDPPELIPELVREWEDGNEVVLAARRSRQDPLSTRLLGSLFNRLFHRFVFRDWPIQGCDFMLVSRRVAEILVRTAEKNSYIFGQVLWVGFRRSIVFYDRQERQHGGSRWTLPRKIKYFVDAFTAFSYLPVRAASVLGLLLALTGFIYAALVVVLRLLNIIQEPGFSALMVVVLVAAGVQLVVVGLLGEYLWRVLEESRRRPVFIVAAELNMAHDGNLVNGQDAPATRPLGVAGE
jgi:polyisoprenyl-phosphate glycosyltransferase